MKTIHKQKSSVSYYPIIGFLLCILAMSSCSRTPYYTAKSTHLMTLNQEGDIAAAITADADIMSDQSLENEHQYSLHAAYSPLRNMTVSSNFNFIFPKKRGEIYRKGFDYDIAIGNYFIFDYFPNRMDTEDETIFIESFLTFGQGRFTSIQNNIGPDFRYNRFGAQFGLHYQYIDGIYYSVGLICRPSMVQYSRVNFTGPPDFELAEKLDINNRQFTNEISFNLKFGAEKLLVFFNCYSLQEFKRNELNLADNNGIQFGLMFNIDAWLHSSYRD